MAESRLAANGPVRFGVFELDSGAGELRKQGLRIKLQDQPLQVLQILLERPGQVVTREELQRRLWPSNTFVEFDKGIYNAIKRLRETLDDEAETPRYIETIPRRGYRFIMPLTSANGRSSVAETLTKDKQGVRRWFLWAVATAVVVGLVTGGLFVSNAFRVRDRVLATSVPRIQSVAVLPLVNLSGDSTQDYFSDGMTDALITDLAQIGSLKVISRTSSMQYKQTKKTLPEIARELRVDGIIEGTVQRSGDRVRITAQLIHAPSDKHLWANSYERDQHDAFILEREVAGDVANQVQTRLTSQEQARIVPSQPANLKGLEAYLQGNYHLNSYGRGGGDEEKRKAAECFQQAIDADPTFAPAYNGLANSHFVLMWPSRQDADIATKAAERAVVLDPNLSDAHATLGFIKFNAWNWPGSEEEYRRAIGLNPNNADAHHRFGQFLDATGRRDEGWREQETAQELDPNNDHLSDALMIRGRYDEAIAMVQMMLKRHPDDGYLHSTLFKDYVQTGKYEEAVPQLEQTAILYGFPQIAADIHRTHAVSGYRGAVRETAKALEHLLETHQVLMPGNIAEFYATIGEKDRAFYWLERVYAQHDVHMAASDVGLEYLNWDFRFDSLRSDPRFKDLVRRVGLPEAHANDSGGSSQQKGHN